MRHLAVLEEAGVIATTKGGRVRSCALRSQALAPMRGWQEEQRQVWEARRDRLDDDVTTLYPASVSPAARVVRATPSPAVPGAGGAAGLDLGRPGVFGLRGGGRMPRWQCLRQGPAGSARSSWQASVMVPEGRLAARLGLSDWLGQNL
jgi:hypothetical protein